MLYEFGKPILTFRWKKYKKNTKNSNLSKVKPRARIHRSRIREKKFSNYKKKLEDRNIN